MSDKEKISDINSSLKMIKLSLRISEINTRLSDIEKTIGITENLAKELAIVRLIMANIIHNEDLNDVKHEDEHNNLKILLNVVSEKVRVVFDTYGKKAFEEMDMYNKANRD